MWRRLGEPESRLRRLLDHRRLADPSGDERGVAAGVERGAVPRDLGVALGDRLAEPRRFVVFLVFGERGPMTGLGEAPQRFGQAVVAKFFGQKTVYRIGDRFLAEVENRRMRDLVLADVVTGRFAPVIDPSVVHAAIHDASAQPTSEQPAEQVRVPAATPGFSGLANRPPRLDGLLGALVEVGADNRWVRLGARPHPFVRVVPAVAALVTERDVVNVDEDFIGAGAVPNLTAGVARVAKDGPDGGGLPHLRVPVRVTRTVVGGRARDAVMRKAACD
nr:hypothetical protein [Actinoplanes sp. N902-109]